MGKFQKGISGNPNGRPVGSLNRSTTDLRVQVRDFLTSNWAKVQEKFDSLEPREQLIFLERLLKYSIPQMSTISAKIDYENLTDTDLDTILDRLTEKI